MIEKNKLKNRLSKSKLKSFAICPKRYWFDRMEPAPFLASTATVKGTRLHSIFDNLYKSFGDIQEYRSKEQLYDELMSQLRETKEDTYKEIAKTDWNLPKHTPEQKQMFLDLLPENEKVEYEKQVKMFVDWIEQLGFTYPENCEEKIYDEDFDFVALYDRLEFDGKVRIVMDYKTGKEHDLSDYTDDELPWYAFFIEKKYPEKKIDYVLIYFVDLGKAKLVKYTEEMSMNAMSKFQFLEDGVDECIRNNNWPAQLNNYCGYCPYNEKCKMYQWKLKKKEQDKVKKEGVKSVTKKNTLFGK